MALQQASTPRARLVGWLCVAGLLLIGAYLHLSGYNYGLNLFEHGGTDETRIYQDAYYQTHGLTDKITLPGYPPGILALDYAAYSLLHLRYNQPDKLYTVEGLHLVRLWAGITNLVTALCLILTGRALKHPLAGWLAACLFLASLSIYQNTVTALSESFQAAAIILTVYLTILALTNDKPRYILLATLCALLATISKYPSATVLAIPFVACLWQMARQNWRRWGAALLGASLITGVCAAWLLFGYQVGRLSSIGTESAVFEASVQALQANPLTLITDPTWREILGFATAQVHLTPLVMLALLLVGLAFYWRGAFDWQRALVIGLGFFYLLWCMLVPLYLEQLPLMARYATPVAPLGALLVGLALSSIVVWIAQRVGRPLVSYALVALISLVWIAPHAAEVYARSQRLALPSVFPLYLDWVHRALPTDGTLLIRQVDWLFFTQNDTTELTVPTRTWYQGYLPERRREDWLKDAIIYAYVEDYEIEQLKQQPNGSDDLAQMLLLKRLPPENSGAWRDSSINVYRLYPMQHTADATFGNMIHWAGYDISATEIEAGATVTFSPYWQAPTTPNTNYNVYLHLVPLDSRDVIAQTDGQPTHAPDYPTSQWNDPNEIILGTPFSVSIPPETPAGTYRLIMGVYDWQSGQRLLTSTGEDFIEIAEIEIEANAAD